MAHQNRKSISLAVIGCGAVFELFYLQALKRICNNGTLEVVLLVDTSESYASSYLKYFPSAQIARRLDEGLRTVKIDRALVLTPPSSHATILAELARIGVHVYCEKPLTVSPQEAIATRDLFKKQSLLCKVGFVRRMFPNLQALKELFEQLGTSRMLTITDGEVFRWPIKTNNIFKPEEVGGGVIWDKLSHSLDLIHWIDGIESVERVISNCRPSRVPVDILVEGRTRTGRFKVAVSWTDSLPNLVRASDGTNTITSKNGLVDKLETTLNFYSSQSIPFNVSTYEEAVEASLREFLRLSKPEDKTPLASADDSVSLTEYLSIIDSKARGACS